MSWSSGRIGQHYASDRAIGSEDAETATLVQMKKDLKYASPHTRLNLNKSHINGFRTN
jgi:hypothetical protein